MSDAPYIVLNDHEPAMIESWSRNAAIGHAREWAREWAQENPGHRTLIQVVDLRLPMDVQTLSVGHNGHVMSWGEGQFSYIIREKYVTR